MSSQPSRNFGRRIADEQYTYLDPANVREHVASYGEDSEAVDKLAEFAAEEFGLERTDETFGATIRSQPREPVLPPEDTVGGHMRILGGLTPDSIRDLLGMPDRQSRDAVEELEFTYLVQDVTGDQGTGALIITSIETGANRMDYHALMTTPRGDVSSTEEWVFDPEEGQVVPARSWLSRFRECLGNNCAWNCVSGVWECWNGSWARWWDCMVNRCGNCAIDCAACATCDCAWHCRWNTGCCG